ncbi:hypothetical protein [Parasitella parasitica]|uniref:Nuclear pore complex protein Nup85 n=1 Tax=Parasitella parasitica TaxID=35722 RepID=A0A0B7MXE3_9FUNG|nr:hypothetical protein [Parasitella parasitica]
MARLLNNQYGMQFYRESYSIFYELRSHLESNQSRLSQETVLGDRDVIGILSKYIDLTYAYTQAEKYIRIWDLCQRLYFPMESADLIISLRDWLNCYDELPNVEEAKCQRQDDEEESSPVGPAWIWEYARRHLLRGNLEEAMDMLTFGQSFVEAELQPVITKIVELIAGLNDILSCCSSSDNKTLFWEKWASWNEQCKIGHDEIQNAFRIQHNRTPGNSELSVENEKKGEIKKLYYILMGDQKYINPSGTYFEVVLGNAWFAKPQSSLTGLKSLAQDIENTATDDACSYFLMGQFDEAFSMLLANDFWLHAHLGYALIITGNFATDAAAEPEGSSPNYSENIIHPIYYSIQSYAQNIAQEFDMLEEAMIYLNCCQSNKEIWIIELLGDPILPLKNIEYLHTILDIASQCGLPLVEKHIHKGIGHRYEHANKLRQATIEYGKAQDLQSLDRLSHHEFSRYLRTGKLGDVVTDMESLKACPHYAILITYHELRQHLAQKRWKEASLAILHLLENKHLPPKFETVLLIDNLPILNEPTHYYSSENVILFIGLLKQIAQDASNQAFIAKYYKFIEKQEYSPDIVTAKIRERLAYKAATAPTEVC